MRESRGEKRSRRQVTVATCEKWQRECDRDYQTLLCLRYDVDTANRSLVDTLWCEPTKRGYDTRGTYLQCGHSLARRTIKAATSPSTAKVSSTSLAWCTCAPIALRHRGGSGKI